MVEDDRYGFSTPRQTQPTVTPVTPQTPTQNHSPVQPALLALPPPCVIADNHSTSDSGSDSEVLALQPEIDEQSDGEDECQAHALLHAAPTLSVAALIQQSPPAAVQYGDRSFAVRIPTYPWW